MRIIHVKTKICIDCGKRKRFSKFQRHNKAKDHRRPECRECDKLRRQKRKESDPISYRIRNMAHDLLKRLKYTNEYKNHCYEGIECKIGTTTQEVFDYINTHFRSEIECFINKGETPSLDRIDSKKHYETGNLRIITWRENSRLGGMKSSEHISVPVIIVYPNRTRRRFPSIKSASIALGVKRDTVYRWLNGSISTKGFKARYAKK